MVTRKQDSDSAVATEGSGGPYPPNGCLSPPFQFIQNTVFGISRKDKTTDNDKKKE